MSHQTGGFETGPVWHLALVISRLEQDHGDPDELAGKLGRAIKLAAGRLSDAQRLALCHELALPTTLKGKDVSLAAAQRALLVLGCAAMFHARLDKYLPGVSKPALDARSADGDIYSGDWPPPTLVNCLTAPTGPMAEPVGDLHDGWQTILALDYRPIFETACRALRAPYQNYDWSQAVSGVAQTALRISRAAVATRHDLLGRVFHRLLIDARYDGSYYTSTAAAVLFAGLAIRPSDVPENLSDYRLIDPACGTGTLLMAAAQRIHHLRGPST